MIGIEIEIGIGIETGIGIGSISLCQYHSVLQIYYRTDRNNIQ